MFKYFKVDSNTVKTDLDKQRRKLALKYHPDKGGSVSIMSAINDEYDKALKYIKNPHKQNPHSNNTGTKKPYNKPHSGSSEQELKDFFKQFFNGGKDKEDYYYQRYREQQQNINKQQRKDEEWQQRREEFYKEVERREYFIHFKISIFKFPLNKRENIISSVRKDIKHCIGCKLYIGKRKKSEWYKLFEYVEFKIKSKNKSDINYCHNILQKRFYLYELKSGFKLI